MIWRLLPLTRLATAETCCGRGGIGKLCIASAATGFTVCWYECVFPIGRLSFFLWILCESGCSRNKRRCLYISAHLFNFFSAWMIIVLFHCIEFVRLEKEIWNSCLRNVTVIHHARQFFFRRNRAARVDVFLLSFFWIFFLYGASFGIKKKSYWWFASVRDTSNGYQILNNM